MKKQITLDAKKSLLYEADGVTLKSGSFDALRCRVQSAIDAAIQSGADMDLDGDNDAMDYAWIQDLFPDSVVYSMNGNLFQCSYTDDGETVTLGTPVEVEASYSQVADDTEDDTQESHRTLAREAVSLSESAYDSSKGELTVTVIKPGFSKNSTKGRKRYYPAETLKRDHKIFEGAKMFADHQTEQEARARPEGSVNNWVASLGKTWAESDGTVKAKATVIDPPFKTKLDRLNEKGLLNDMGVSVRVAAEVSEAEIEGEEACRIDELVAMRSVDFVTFAGAGGLVEAIESDRDNENDIDVVNEAQLRKRRPDLVELIETHSQEKLRTMKSIEQQLAESQTQLTALTKENAELKTKFEEAQKVGAKAAVAAEVTKQLAEAKLPDFAQARIRKQFADSDKATPENIKEAIVAEQDYLKKAGVKTVTPKNLGAADNGTTNESGEQKTPNLEEAFALLPGMSKEDAKHAAAV